jgi:hypothetical protein
MSVNTPYFGLYKNVKNVTSQVANNEKLKPPNSIRFCHFIKLRILFWVDIWYVGRVHHYLCPGFIQNFLKF